jgi:hypothetical protein
MIGADLTRTAGLDTRLHGTRVRLRGVTVCFVANVNLRPF